MNDERYLRDWLQDTTDSNVDPRAAADKVVARLPQSRQRRRWLPWLPARHPKPDEPNGRTRIMLSPVKTLAGAAAASLVVMSLLIAAPFSSGPASIPPSAELDPELAGAITGTIIESSSPSDASGTYVRREGLTRLEDIHYTNTWETSDPRLSGTATYDAEWIAFPREGFQIEASYHVVENEEGRWVGPGTTLVLGQTTQNTDVAILRGEGGYEGLTAYVLMDWTSLPGTIQAAIFPGDMPVAGPFTE